MVTKKSPRETARAETVCVRQYLLALKEHDSGMPTAEELEASIADVVQQLENDELSVLNELELHQQHIDLKALLSRAQRSDLLVAELEELERAFIKCARSFAERKGISRAAWRKMGVKASVLDEAGL